MRKIAGVLAVLGAVAFAFYYSRYSEGKQAAGNLAPEGSLDASELPSPLIPNDVEALTAGVPKNARALALVGARMQRESRLEEALAVYIQALSLTQNTEERALIQLQLGEIYDFLDEPEEAMTRWESVSGSAALATAAVWRRADLYRRGDRAKWALPLYQRTVEQIPKNPNPRLGRVYNLILLGQYSQARRALEQDLAQFPDHGELRQILARILAASAEDEVRDGAMALRLLAPMMSEDAPPNLKASYAMALAEAGQFEQAVAWQQSAVNASKHSAYDPDLPFLLKHMQGYVEGRPCREPWPDFDHFRETRTYQPVEALPTFTRRLAHLAASSDPGRNKYLNQARAEALSQELTRTRDPNRFLALQPDYGRELLNAGKSLEAIEAFQRLRQFIENNRVPFEGEGKTWLLHRLALSHLRLGEQENCQLNHGSDSCLLPIRDSGVHQLKRGSRGAIRVLREILAEFPEDMEARWLLNLAYMTLGEYPEGVPEPWRIPPERFEPEESFPRFADIAGKVGLDVDALSGGGIMEDFNNDGLLDIMVSSWGLTDQLRLFLNLGEEGFEDVTEDAGLMGEIGGLNLKQADYNNDGFADVLVLRGAWLDSEGNFPNSLLRNNGDGSFTNVTEEAGLLSFHPTQTAAWFDYNNDGWLDLFIGNETTENASHPCELYRNNGDGGFSEVAAEAGVAVLGFVKGVTSGDYDNDGRTDLYISCYTSENLLFRNMGPRPGAGPQSWYFEDVTARAGVAEPLLSFPTWFWDYDNDGWLDLFVADYENRGLAFVAQDYLGQEHEGARSRLYRNNRDGSFSDVTRAAGLYRVLIAMGSNYGDIDNDGRLDFYVGTGTPSLNMLIPNRMFRNHPDGRFRDITTAGGFGHLQKGHGVSIGDLDNDGDQDVHIVMGGAYEGDNYRNALFENPGNDHSWLKLQLVGVATNRGAVGARIKLTFKEGEGFRFVHRTIGSGGSFGASPSRLEIGLGRATDIRSVEVLWPVTGKSQIFSGLAPNHAYRITEGQALAEEIALHAFAFSGLAGEGHEGH